MLNCGMVVQPKMYHLSNFSDLPSAVGEELTVIVNV